MDFSKALNLILDKINGWGTELIKMLPNLILACVILVLGIFLAKKIKKTAQKHLSRIFPTKTIANLSISLIYVFLVAVVLFVVLRVMNLEKAITTALAGAGIMGIGLAFAFQDIASNFISGIILTFSRPFNIDDQIRVNDIEGFVTNMRLRDTTIRTYQGQLVSVPNKIVFQNPIINFTRFGKRRADISIVVSKYNDLKTVRQAALEGLKHVPKIYLPNTRVLFREDSNSSRTFVAECWVDSSNFDDYREFINDCIIAMDIALKNAKVATPNDQYTVDFNKNAAKVLDGLRKISEN